MEDIDNYPGENNQGVSNQPQDSSKKIWLFIGIPVGLVIIGLLIFLFVNFSQKTISEDKISQGTNFELKENKEIKFILDEEEHTITVESVNDDSVDLIIQSDPIQVNIGIGEEKKFDLDDDGFFDIKVKLNSISEGIPELYIIKIHELVSPTEPAEYTDTVNQDGDGGETAGDGDECWDCGNWSECTDGTKTRDCIDRNNCGTEENKPATTETCCSYTCDEWSTGCSDSWPKQIRSCRWSNTCTASEIPATERDCVDCADSDAGKDYFVKGTTGDDFYADVEDTCSTGSTLIEYFCDENDSRALETHECEFGCEDGACRNESQVQGCVNGDSICSEGCTYSQDDDCECQADLECIREFLVMLRTVECENHALQCMDEALFLSIQKTSAIKPTLLSVGGASFF